MQITTSYGRVYCMLVLVAACYVYFFDCFDVIFLL